MAFHFVLIFIYLSFPPCGAGNQTQDSAIDEYKQVNDKMWTVQGMKAQAWVIHTVESIKGQALLTCLKNSGQVVSAWLRFEKILLVFFSLFMSP